MSNELGQNKGVAPLAVEAAAGLAHSAADEVSEAMTTPTSKRTPAFQFYPNDFLGSSKVQRMSLTERGAYITLLAHCWLDGGLSTDLKTLAAILHVKPIQFDRMWSGALHECFYEKNGKLQNARLDKERKKQADFSKRQSDRANAGWDARRNARDRNAVALQEPHSSLSSSSISSSSSKPPMGATVRARGGTLIVPPKNFANVAHFSDCGDVPIQLHSEFVRKFMNAGADETQAEHQARAFYAAVELEFSGKVVGDKPMDFWRAQFAAAHGSGDKRTPQWAR